MTMRNELATVTLEQLTAATEKTIPWGEGDEKMVLVIVAASATDLTVKAGNGLQGVKDKTFTVAAGTHLLKLESGKYKNITGANKGNIVVLSTGTPKVGVAALM